MERHRLLGLSPAGFHALSYTLWRPSAAGEGAPDRAVICVHGLTRNGRDFDPLAGALAEAGFLVVCPDMVGRGKSEWLAAPEGYGLPQYCADVTSLIARLGVERVDWVGTSMGGLIGMMLAASGISLLAQVQLRKGEQLYINDGIYGSLSEMVQTDLRLPARLIRLNEQPGEEQTAFTLSGPTCDSLDVIPGTFDLPSDAREGDWIEIDQVGAYSNALATHFNGFHPETFIEVHDRPLAGEA